MPEHFKSRLTETRSSYGSRLVLESRSLAKDFIPDGNLKKTAWRKARWTRFNHDWQGKRHYPQAETRFASAWTPRQVYVAFWCKYSVLNVFEGGDPEKDTLGLWNRDVVEAFLNPDPACVNHYYEFEVAPNNLWVDLEINLDRQPVGDAHWNSGFTHATRIRARAWTCEMRIPVASMTDPNYELRPGAEWRGNFFRADGRGDDTKRRFLTWSPTLTPKPNFHVPTRFGIIRFVK
ncbi:MAG TPA: carbohydrate-binding family 9-like protein [Terriglobia bacterium]|nr:carbohydrate-binding family 9-like protein [Terriglobia bacterium]